MNRQAYEYFLDDMWNYEADLADTRSLLEEAKINYNDTVEYLESLKAKKQTRSVTKKVKIWTDHMNWRYVEYARWAEILRKVYQTKPEPPLPEI
jgi:site-specific recombinase XerD